MELTSTHVRVISPPSLSPDGSHLAALIGTDAVIYRTASLEIAKFIQLQGQTGMIRWSRRNARSSSSQPRILFATDDTVRIWSLQDQSWFATINNGTCGMGRIANAEFGFCDDEVLVFSDFGSKVTVWNVKTGRTIEIRDPKCGSGSHEYRPNSEIFAILTRTAAQDTLTIHAPRSYKAIKAAALPTSDAQGLKWSPDGMWIAIWDTDTAGQKVFIYTADGNLYRTHTGDEDQGGLQCIEWSPDSRYLAISGYDHRVTLLSTRTFSPVVYLEHAASVQLRGGAGVWQEQINSTGERVYKELGQPISPPRAPPSPGNDDVPRSGVSAMSFDKASSILATRDDSTPTTVWLWDLVKLTPLAVMIQHSPVRQLSWRLQDPELLLIKCSQDDSTAYVWDTRTMTPEAIAVPFPKTTGRIDYRWITGSPGRGAQMLVNDKQGFATFRLLDTASQTENCEQNDDDVDASMDSVYEALVGRSASRGHDEVDLLESQDDVTEAMDDTFVGIRKYPLSSR